jgi:hypothetical protein
MGRALVHETLDRWRDGPVLVEFLLLRAGPRILIFLAHRSGARARNITSARRLLPGGYEKRAASRRHVVCSRAAASEPLSRVVGRANRWSRQRCTAGAARLRRAGHTTLPPAAITYNSSGSIVAAGSVLAALTPRHTRRVSLRLQLNTSHAGFPFFASHDIRGCRVTAGVACRRRPAGARLCRAVRPNTRWTPHERACGCDRVAPARAGRRSNAMSKP